MQAIPAVECLQQALRAGWITQRDIEIHYRIKRTARANPPVHCLTRRFFLRRPVVRVRHFQPHGRCQRAAHHLDAARVAAHEDLHCMPLPRPAGRRHRDNPTAIYFSGIKKKINISLLLASRDIQITSRPIPIRAGAFKLSPADACTVRFPG